MSVGNEPAESASPGDEIHLDISKSDRPSDFNNRNVKFADIQRDGAKPSKTMPSVSRMIEDPWAKRMALSLDGGGIRGLGQLLILQKLMVKIKKIEKDSGSASSASSDFLQEYPMLYTKASALPNLYDEDIFLPAHYFDYFAGTSAGGIVAILLGRLRCDIDVAIEHYKSIWKGLGAGMTAMDRMSPMGHAKKANTRRVQEGLRSILLQRDQWLSNNAKGNGSSVFVTDSSIAKTIVLTVEIDKHKGTQKPYLFRSYDSSETKGSKGSNGFNRPPRQDLDRVGIAYVASASCAAPRDFSGVHLGEPSSISSKFRDGSLWTSNPAMELYTEMLSMCITDDNPQPVGLILSIGTGEAKTSGLIGAFRRRRSSASRTQRGDLVNVDEKLHALSRREGFRYSRLPGPSYLNHLSLNEWQDDPSSENAFDQLQKSVNAYCDTQEIDKELQSCAEYLVEVRQKRAKTQQWARFALGIYYTCDLCDKTKWYTSYPKRSSAPLYGVKSSDRVNNLDFLLSPGPCSLPGSFGPRGSTASIKQSKSGPPSIRIHDASADLLRVEYPPVSKRNFDYNVDFVMHLLKEHRAPPPDALGKDGFDRWVADRAHTAVR